MARCIFLTGLPCSGKSTIAKELLRHFDKVQWLDGDVIRETPLAKDVGFTPEDRQKHILRMGQLAKMFVDQGVNVVCSFVAPQRYVRRQVRDMFDAGEYCEVYLSTPVDVCSERDVKGMYAKARKGEIKNFTGVGATYEPPMSDDTFIALDTNELNLESCVSQILKYCGRVDERKVRWHWYFGRWNGGIHKGHAHIIQQSLDKYPEDNVMLAIRDVEPDEKNPWTAAQVQEMLSHCYANEPRVSVCIVPDISSVEYGRGVGYEVNEIKVNKDIAGISGTECRKMIAEGNPAWKEKVPPHMVEFLEAAHGRK